MSRRDPAERTEQFGRQTTVATLSRDGDSYEALSLERNVINGIGTSEQVRRVYVAAEGLHADVFKQAKVQVVDPTRCISLKKFRSRDLCCWGVRMIKNSILGHSKGESFVKGYISSGRFPILVEVPEEFLYLVEEHFLEEGKDQEEAAQMAKSGSWFHVVDGGHIHLALIELIFEFSENFGGFSWPVVVIPWMSEKILQSIARMSNEMQRETHVIDFTLPDVMQNLRDIIDLHSKDTGVAIVPGQKVKTGFIKEVMAIYAGCPGYADNTMRCVCGIVLKLSSPVVQTMRKLLTEECEDYCRRLGSRRPFGDDTRVYKKLISSQSLKGVKEFLTHGEMLDEDRINVVHRIRFLARERECYKPFQASEISQQCRCIVNARAEMKKVQEFLGEEVWPDEMENLRRNLLQTTLLDGDIREHIGAGSELLPAFIDAYIRATGAHGTQKLGLFRRRMAAENSDVSAQANSQNGKNTENPNEEVFSANRESQTGTNEVEDLDNVVAISRNAKASEETNPPELAENVTTEPVVENSREENENSNLSLETCGVTIHKMSVMEFERNSVDIDAIFDFVISDPFQKIPADERQDQSGIDELFDDKGVTIYLQCLRRLLVPGAYCFIFLEWNRLHQWATCSTNSQFEVVCEPFSVMKDARRVQKMTTKGLQSIYDPALVIKKPGRHPNGFTVDKKSPYVHLPGCRIPRWCNAIDGVPPPSQRLTFKPSRAHVRPNERPCALFIEIFQTFCPENGKVLDTKAGALTTGLASIATERNCVLLETDERCLSFAVPRIRDFAVAKIADKDSSTLFAQSRTEERIEDGFEEEQLNNRDDVNDDVNDDVVLRGTDLSGTNDREDAAETESQQSDVTVAVPSQPSTVRRIFGKEQETACQTSGKSSFVAWDDPQRSLEKQRCTSLSEISRGTRSSEEDERDENLCKTPQREEVMNPEISQKRSRGRHSSAISSQTEIEITPSSIRRSKRTRRPVSRYER